MKRTRGQVALAKRLARQQVRERRRRQRGERALGMLAEGMSCNQIGKRLGVCRGTAHLVIKRAQERRDHEAIFAESRAEAPILEWPVYLLGLSTRARSGLEGLRTVGELVELSESEVLKRKNLGRVTLAEIVDELQRHGLRLMGRREPARRP